MCEYDTATTVRQWLYTAPKFIYLLTAILMLLLFANLTARHSLFDSEITVVLSDVFTSFNQYPINELTITSDSECPSGYERVELGNWGGAFHGCVCNDGAIFNQSCPVPKRSDCHWVDSEPSKKIYTWNGYSFCIQRSSSIIYKSNNTECPENTIQCTQRTCVDSSESCPLTDIRIVPIDGTNYTNYEEIPVGEETRLIFSRGMYDSEDITHTNRSEEFIVNLNVSFYHLPCMNPQKIPASSNKNTPYPLSMIPEEGCGQFGYATHLHEIEEMPISTILVENGVSEVAIERLPGFSDYISGRNAILVSLKNYTVREGTRIQEINPEIFGTLDLHETEFVDNIWPLAFVLTILTVALAVSIPLEGFLRFKNKEEQRIMLRLIAYLNIGALGVSFVCFMINGSIALNSQTDLNPIVYSLKDLRTHKAFDQIQIEEILKLFINQVNDDVYVILSITITLLFLGFVGMCVLSILTLIDISQVRRFRETTTHVPTGTGTRDRRKKNKKYDTKNKGNEMLLMNQH